MEESSSRGAGEGREEREGGGASGEEGRPERRGLWRGSGRRRKGTETILEGHPAHRLTSSAWPSSRSKVTTHTHSSQAEKRAQGISAVPVRAARPEDVDPVAPSPPPACRGPGPTGTSMVAAPAVPGTLQRNAKVHLGRLGAVELPPQARRAPEQPRAPWR